MHEHNVNCAVIKRSSGLVSLGSKTQMFMRPATIAIVVAFAVMLHVLQVPYVVGYRRVMFRPPVSGIQRFCTARHPANGLSLDSALAADRPDLLISHLHSRKSDSLVKNKVLAIKQLRAERVQLIGKGDLARNTRKLLSKEIGTLMKSGKTTEAADLKRKVEQASDESHAFDEKLAVVDNQLNQIVLDLPNLLDDR
jgi:hypothetical protein